MVIDGRQSGISEGVTLAELADQLIAVGVFTGVNMDGGGSSTMVIRNINGTPKVVNTPIEGNVPGNESKVANHLGISLQQP
jgi:exopolysaccharide biosynthesis protein